MTQSSKSITPLLLSLALVSGVMLFFLAAAVYGFDPQVAIVKIVWIPILLAVPAGLCLFVIAAVLQALRGK